MTETPSRNGISRRNFVKVASAATLVLTAHAVIHPIEAWGLETKGLTPETMQALIQAARDIYPHDKVPDRFYAVAVKDYDTKSAADPKVKSLVEDGVAALNAAAKSAHGTSYVEVAWEEDRVAILRKIESTPFFQTLRGGLVVGLYNQKDVWPIFGYEGDSASKGGYIDRGFNDITWL
jgi:hypothetical protein